jgi:ubiquinone/menaquinone biosynthesis C-methylase UbiE
MLADALEYGRVVGLDNSEHFIGLAEKTATDDVSFRLHDVTRVPFPVGPCHLIYARFLLTHQVSPETLIAKWAAQLCPGGRLLLEEVDSIDISVAVFAEYMEIVEAMLAEAGQELCVGARLDAMPTPAGLVRTIGRIAHVPVRNDLAAKMFSMNIQTWKHNPFVQQNCSPESIRKLAENLTDLAAKPTSEKGIEWQLRQLVYEQQN